MDDSITRSEMACIIVRAAGVIAKDALVEDYAWVEGVFSDVSRIPRQYRDYVFQAYASGILKGNEDGTFGGMDPLARAEAATVMCRIYDRQFEAPPKVGR